MNKELIKYLLEEMNRLQDAHPKATILFDIERRRIEITYPLPKLETYNWNPPNIQSQPTPSKPLTACLIFGQEHDLSFHEEKRA